MCLCFYVYFFSLLFITFYRYGNFGKKGIFCTNCIFIMIFVLSLLIGLFAAPIMLHEVRSDSSYIDMSDREYNTTTTTMSFNFRSPDLNRNNLLLYNFYMITI